MNKNNNKKDETNNNKIDNEKVIIDSNSNKRIIFYECENSQNEIVLIQFCYIFVLIVSIYLCLWL